MTGNDRDLYERFAELRREEEARVPPLSIPSLTAHEYGRRRLSPRLAAAAACLAAMVALVGWLLPGWRVPHPGLNHEREPAATSIASWKPATDFLLDTPGRELLQGVPAIGEGHAGAIAPGPRERPRYLRKQPLR